MLTDDDKAEDIDNWDYFRQMKARLTPSKILKIRRENAELSQAALAEKCGIASSNIALMETGKRNIGAHTARKLAEALSGKIRNKDVKVAIVPPDKGGYTVLDIVFGDAMAAELVLKPYEIKDEATGKTISGNSYGVLSHDENGEIYECAIKPFRSSDKSLLNMLLK